MGSAALSEYAIRHPIRVIVVATILTLCVLPGWLRLRLNTDGHALVSADAPEVVKDREIREQFGIEDSVIVLIRSTREGGVYDIPVLEFVKKVSESAQRIDGVSSSSITSLATEVGFERRPNSLQFKTLIETLPENDAELSKLREDVRRVGLYVGSIVSKDERATAVYIGTPQGCDRVAFYHLILHALEGVARPEGVEVHVIGAPVAEALLGLHILEDLGVPAFLLGATTFGSDDSKEDAWRVPTSLYAARRLIARGIGLLPITILLMMLVFAICFRRLLAAVIPLMEVGACLVFLFGLMGFCSIPIYLTIAVVPIILTAAGVCDEIHILSAFRRQAMERQGASGTRDGRLAIARATMAEISGPIIRTSITTAIGFASFAWAPIEPVRMFGIVTAIGVLYCTVWSMTVMPAMFVLFDVNRIVALPRGRQDARPLADGDGQSRSNSLPAGFERWADFLARRRGLVVPAFLILVALGSLGIRDVIVQDSWIEGFDPHSEFREATGLFNEQFYGAHILQICIDASARTKSVMVGGEAVNEREFPMPRDWETSPGSLVGDPISLRRVKDGPSGVALPPELDGRVWRSWIESTRKEAGRIIATTPRHDGQPQFWIGKLGDALHELRVAEEPMTSPRVLQLTRSLSELIRLREELAVGGVLGADDYVATTRFMMAPDTPDSRRIPDDPPAVRALWTRYAFVRGEARKGQLIDPEYNRALTSIYLRNANFVDTARLMADIRRFEESALAPEGIRLGFAGDVAVSQSLIGAIVTTQLQSLLFSLLGILAVTTLMGRSLVYGIYCALPCALSLPLVFAAMGWMGIPLGVATSMFAAMIIGAGVDFAIHVLDRFRHERRAGRDVDAAIRAAIGRTGFPVTVNALSLSAGMLVLTLSQVPANARLGILLAIGLVSCLLVSLVLLPALLKWRPVE